jgi:hypothetical protein
MKNAVFRDKKTQILSHRKNITSPIKSPVEVSTAVTMKTVVFLRSVTRLLVIANVVPSFLILSTLMTEAIHSTETFVLTRATRHHIPEEGIFLLHSLFIVKFWKIRNGFVKKKLRFVGRVLQQIIAVT